MKKAIYLPILLLSLMAVFWLATSETSGTCGRPGDDLTWVLDDQGTLTISGNGQMADYWPSYSLYGEKAPWGTEIMSVIISDGVKNIGEYAFHECRTLTSVTLPDSLTVIGAAAFSGCWKLHSVLIPDTVTYIGSGAFSFCFDLSCISLPNGIKSIEGAAFHSCFSLESINLPEGLSCIGNGAFHGSSITSITLPESITMLEGNPFSDCSLLKTIKVSIDSDYLAVIDGVLFSKPDKRLVCYPGALPVGDYSIPNGINMIGDDAFNGCQNIEKVIIPDGMKSLGDSAFAFSGLSSLVIPNTVNSIGEAAFMYCNNLTSITIPDGVRTVDKDAFFGTNAQIIANLGTDGARALGKAGYCFRTPGLDCELQYRYTNDSLDRLYLINVDHNATSFTVPEGVTCIADSAFAGCQELTSVEISNSVISIGSNAFQTCDKLKSISIPSSVIQISSTAFDINSNQLVFTVERNSYAKEWCKENGFEYTYPDIYDWLTAPTFVYDANWTVDVEKVTAFQKRLIEMGWLDKVSFEIYGQYGVLDDMTYSVVSEIQHFAADSQMASVRDGMGFFRESIIGDYYPIDEATYMYIMTELPMKPSILNPIATITMENGSRIVLELFPEKAPNTVANFINLANSGFYDGLTFHRVISGFMIQGGDPDGVGTGGPGYSIRGEFAKNGFAQNDLKHVRGVLSMARAQAYDSAGSQFFIMHADASYLDGAYAAFGRVLKGMEAVDAIATTQTNPQNNRPLTPQVIQSIRVYTFGVKYPVTTTGS